MRKINHSTFNLLSSPRRPTIPKRNKKREAELQRERRQGNRTYSGKKIFTLVIPTANISSLSSPRRKLGSSPPTTRTTSVSPAIRQEKSTNLHLFFRNQTSHSKNHLYPHLISQTAHPLQNLPNLRAFRLPQRIHLSTQRALVHRPPYHRTLLGLAHDAIGAGGVSNYFSPHVLG